jgi:hypothetical protein
MNASIVLIKSLVEAYLGILTTKTRYGQFRRYLVIHRI